MSDNSILFGSSDWRHGKNAAQCNRYMLENELHCDITFIVGTGDNRQEIPAHKYILIARSEVFEAMLVGPMHEHSSQIEIPDVDPAAFKKMLQYMYYDNTKFDEADAYDLLYVSRKYLLTGLVKRCLQRLKTKMSVENVCVILSYADDQVTVDLCLAYIFRYPAEILKSDSFKELSRENVKLIVSNDKLSVREEEVFEAIVLWSEQECRRNGIDVIPENQCEILGDILNLVRYGRMDKHFLLNVCKNFLPEKIYIEIIENIASSIDNNFRTSEVAHDNISSDLPHFANSTNRSCGADVRPKEIWNTRTPMEVLDGSIEVDSGASHIPSVFTHRRDKFRIYRFSKNSVASGKTYDMQTPDSVSFISSSNVDLEAILLYGSCQDEGEYSIHLEIYEDLGGVLSLCHSSERDVTTDGRTVSYELKINPSVTVKADRVYTIRALIRGPPSYFGTNGEYNVTKNGVSVYFITADDDLGLNLTTAEGGQFQGLVLKK